MKQSNPSPLNDNISPPKQEQYRKLPLLSELVLFPLLLFSATLRYVLHPWPQMEATVSMAVRGGFFAFSLIPMIFAILLTMLIGVTIGVPFYCTMCYVWLPFTVIYTIQILLLDQTHCADLRNSGIAPPRRFFEKASWDFFDSAFPYFPSVDCIPCWNTTTATKKMDDGNDTEAVRPLLPPNQQYIFGVHPHGIHCFPYMLFTTKGSPLDKCFPGLCGPKLNPIAATVIFKIPVVRELFLSMGYIDASRRVCEKALACGQSLCICVGGEEESMYSQRGQDIVVLAHRKGFVRLALSYGAHLVPVFGAGNTDTYTTYSIGLKWRLWFQKKTSIALPIFHGRWFTPLPHAVPIRILVGEPIVTPMPKNPGERPSEELVDEYHQRYIEALKDLHKKNVHDRTLIVR